MSTKGKRPMRAVTPSHKIEAIQRVNDGESKASVARDIGVPESTLRGWCKNENKLRYQSSRLSSPDTDKSNDADPTHAGKRARTESPVAPPSPAAAAPPAAPAAPVAAPPPPAPLDAPVELTTRAREPPSPRDLRRPEPGAAASMSAISPLSGLAHLGAPLAHAHLGLSLNDMANNLTLLAQLNPGLSSLSAAPASRALRSVRSPKPAHSGALGLADKYRAPKPPHEPSHYARGRTADPVEDSLWYWLKTQAMLDLSAQSAPAPAPPPRPAAPAAPLPSHLDYNRNSWIWQYCKQLGGAMPPPDDKMKSAAPVPPLARDKTNENILYSQLVKGKSPEEPPRQASGGGGGGGGEVRASSGSPSGAEHKEAAGGGGARTLEGARKARTVLDTLLFSSAGESAGCAGAEGAREPAGEEGADAAEALAHGDKFLSWLEASGDPSVTRMHVHQLRALLHNLRARRLPSHPAAAAATATTVGGHSRRK